MRLPGYAVSRSIRNGLSGGQSQALNSIKALSTNAPLGNWMDGNQSTNSFEPEDEFERRIFGGNSGTNLRFESFFQKLDRFVKPRNGAGSSPRTGRSSQMLDGRGEVGDTLSDGMDEKLEEAAGHFEIDDDSDDYEEEVSKENYSFRPDATFSFGNTYDIKDLDLTKPGVRRAEKRNEFEVTTEEVLRKADFRNVRFLANFITEAGIIIKRSKTGISAKAQRKVAREIKTARAFGLMPFTTMGTKSFVFGRTMESLDKDFEYESLDRSIDNGNDLDES